MTTTSLLPSIKNIEFINNSIMFVHLHNDRTFLVPVNKFPSIQKLNSEEKKQFEIIDETYLSFLAIDEVYSLEELIGIR